MVPTYSDESCYCQFGRPPSPPKQLPIHRAFRHPRLTQRRLRGSVTGSCHNFHSLPLPTSCLVRDKIAAPSGNSSPDYYAIRNTPRKYLPKKFVTDPCQVSLATKTNPSKPERKPGIMQVTRKTSPLQRVATVATLGLATVVSANILDDAQQKAQVTGLADAVSSASKGYARRPSSLVRARRRTARWSPSTATTSARSRPATTSVPVNASAAQCRSQDITGIVGWGNDGNSVTAVKTCEQSNEQNRKWYKADSNGVVSMSDNKVGPLQVCHNEISVTGIGGTGPADRPGRHPGPGQRRQLRRLAARPASRATSRTTDPPWSVMQDPTSHLGGLTGSEHQKRRREQASLLPVPLLCVWTPGWPVRGCGGLVQVPLGRCRV